MLTYIPQKYKKNGKQTHILNKNKCGAPFLRKEHHFMRCKKYSSLSLHERRLIGVGALHIEAMDKFASTTITMHHA